LKWANESDVEKDRRRQLQLTFEDTMLLSSRSKYWDDYNRSPDEGLPEQQLLDDSVKELKEVYQEWLDNIVQDRKTPEWLTTFITLGAAKMADITIRAVIRCWFSSSFWGHQLEEDFCTPPIAQTVATMIAKDAMDIVSYQTAKDFNKEDWTRQSKFIKNWTPKRCVAFAKKMDTYKKLSVTLQHNFGHAMLRIAASSNIILLNTRTVKRGNSLKKYVFVEFHDTILKELHNRHSLLQTSSLLYRPMLIPPVLHTEASSGGYIHKEMRKPVVQHFKSNNYGDSVREQKSSVPSKKVLNSLNGLMLTEWCVNSKVLEVMENLFKNNTNLANLPYYNFEDFMFSAEYPKEGDKIDKAIWCQQRQHAWSEWYKQEQARGRMLVRLKLAHDLLKNGYFYHTMTLDFRGRAYTACELLSPQSSDFDRGLIMFANEVKVTPEGLYWLKVNMANLFDQDKLSLDQRVQWTEDNWDMLQEIAKDPYENRQWIDSRKKKNKSFQRLAAIFDIMREDGMSSVPVQLDGLCNGAQHWSAIMRDASVGEKVGIIPLDFPGDLYQYIADSVTSYCQHHIDEIPWCAKFLEYWEEKIDRKVTKRSTMCDPYGLTFYGIQKYLKVEGHLDWVNDKEKNGAITELARAIKISMDSCLSEPNKGKAYLKSIVEVANDLNKHIEYETPSGFKVVHRYNQINTRRSISKLFNNKELVFYTSSEDVNKRGALQAIAPNFIHSLDAAHMFNTISILLQTGIFSLSMIHDSYGCHCNYVSQMRDVLRNEFIKIHSENQLKNFKEDVQRQLGVMLPDPPAQGELVIDNVKNSDYFFA
jgi:DNA-directed RNA polymerase